MLEMYGNTCAVKTYNSSFPSTQSSPPYSPHVSVVSFNSGEKNVNSSDSLSQLLHQPNVFQIVWENETRRKVLDGSGTLLLSVLSQKVSGSGCFLRTQYLFLNPTGKQVLEMTKVIEDGNDPLLKTTCTVHEGTRVVGFLTHEAGKEMVGYRISGKEMFRASLPPTVTVRGDGKDRAVITTKDNPRSTSLVIFYQDEQLEVKALLLCSAIYYDALGRFSQVISKDVSGGRQIVQSSERSTSRNVEGGNRPSRACDMAGRVTLVLVLVFLTFVLPVILMTAY